jgi:Ser-tRNA(Ala) deacylase AlaX
MALGRATGPLISYVCPPGFHPQHVGQLRDRGSTSWTGDKQCDNSFQFRQHKVSGFLDPAHLKLQKKFFKKRIS